MNLDFVNKDLDAQYIDELDITQKAKVWIAPPFSFSLSLIMEQFIVFSDSPCHKARLLGAADPGTCSGNIFPQCECEVRCRESKELLTLPDQ